MSGAGAVHHIKPGNQRLVSQRTGIIVMMRIIFFDRDADLVVIRRDIERRPPVACEYVLGHPALVRQAGRVPRGKGTSSRTLGLMRRRRGFN